MVKSLKTFFLSATSVFFLFIPTAHAFEPDQKIFLLNVLSWEKILATILGIITIAFITKHMRLLTDRIAQKWNKRRLLLLQARSIVVFVIYFLGGWVITQQIWGLSHEELLLFGAALALALGFALKPIAESVVGGLVLIFDGPFQVGDRVTFHDVYGDIQMIGFRATRLLTLDKTLVTIPNHLFLSEAAFCGNTGVHEMMVNMDFHVALSADLALAKKLVEEAVARAAHVDHQKPIVVLAKEVALGPLPVYQLRAKVVVEDFIKEKLCLTDLTLKVHEALQQHKIPRPSLNSPLF